MSKNILLFLTTFFLIQFSFVSIQAQEKNWVTIHGIILEKNYHNEAIPLQGIKILFTKKVFAFTDKEGKFLLQVPDTAKKIIVVNEKLGNDTIAITDFSKEIKLVYPFVKKMKEIAVAHRREATEITMLTAQKQELISSKELLKAACCNLSESFETTPSVDVSFSDAITGYKQIQLLGLASPYTLITRENIPEVRGIASITGLTFTPGQWIEGMQLSKGTGSVVNGYEGLAGQINIELRKPMEGDKQFYNIYQSNQGRTEANAYFKFEPKEKLYSNVFLHGKMQWQQVDQNHDHYTDQPLGNAFIVANRWMWFGKKGRELQLGAKYNMQNNYGGSLHYNKNENPQTSNYFGMKNTINRIDVWSKIGKLFEHKPWKSMGLQLAFSHHNQDMVFGRKNYSALENTFYANYIFQTIIKNTNHVLKFGGTANYIQKNETVIIDNYKNEEKVLGVFSEYAHSFSKKVNAVIGVRTDYHNLYGIFFTPRFHIRYAPHDNISFRGSFGKSYRTTSIFAENFAYLATNRTMQILPSQTNGIYNLQNEKAYNTGINATYKFKLNYRKGTVSADYYYTHFLNQVVIDWEQTHFIRVYNSTQKSFANSFQIQLDYEPIRKLDVRLAYRMHDVKITYNNDLKQKPLNAKHRAFINVAYTTRSKWSFDYTLQYTGKKRIPSTLINPSIYQFPLQSNGFFTMNFHINKAFQNNLEIYGGVENILNNMQMQTIIDAANPFGQYFDASLIWGNMNGRNVYAGMRIKKI